MATGKPDLPFQVSGNIPPEFREALANKKESPHYEEGVAKQKPQKQEFDEDEFFKTPASKAARKKMPTPDSRVNLRTQGSDALEGLIDRLAERHHWEEFQFASLGKFYDDVPETIHIRPMTGEEEQILATPRFVKKGTAIDKIFQRCIREPIDTRELLSVDRNHLLIYLRGISYTPEYDVEIKCPACSTKFSTTIDLNLLEIDSCPDDYGPEALSGTLPASGFTYSYRLSTGEDEQAISNYRDRRIQMWGDSSEDDTLLYRTVILLEEIEGVKNKKELMVLLKRLPIVDVAHLRNEVSEEGAGKNPSVELWTTLMEELFFFQYHMNMSKQDSMALPVHERKWLIQRFIDQKKRENEAMEKARKAKK
ncbi:unnamed protein product [Symbiodinium microadriaticum]|nr:unnamed protein product [Symbiodinium microadriaticum]